jgi:hypothetical protein
MNFKDINDIEEAIEILVRVMRRNESFSSPEEPFFNPKNNHPHYKLIQN